MKFVFCEGADDAAVIKGVAGSIGLNDIFAVEPFLGKDKLSSFLKSALTRPEFSRNEVTAISIIRDADEDGQAAFQSVCDALQANGFDAPNHNGGLAMGAIKTGVLIIGPKDGKGMLEALCLNSVSHLPEFPCVEQYLECITQKGGRQNFSSKAKVRVWMASQADHELYVGKAAAKGYWPWESPAFDALKTFLKQLAQD